MWLSTSEQQQARFDELGAACEGYFGSFNRPPTPTATSQIENHHLLPLQFRSFFERVGLDVDDYIMKLPVDAHRLKSGNGLHTGSGLDNWNNVWDAFRKEYPRASKEQILDQLDKMMLDFGLK